VKTRGAAAAATHGEPRQGEWLEVLRAYCTGWSLGDADMIRSTVVDNYLWDDPDEGRLAMDDLGAFLPGYRERIDALRDDPKIQPYQVISGFVWDETQNMASVWFCFSVPGTGIEGVSQIKIGRSGVICDHRAYLGSRHSRTAHERSVDEGWARQEKLRVFANETGF
jgi:hypothetical protein